MPEGLKVEDLLNNVVETVSKQKSLSFFEEEKKSSVKSQFNRLFGGDKPVHHILGGGKSADVLLWKNKKISASVLATATATWVLFEWLNYHLLSLVFFSAFLSMLGLFIWSNFSNIVNRDPSQIPRLVIPDELFVNIGIFVGFEVNKALGFLQAIACEGNLKQFLAVATSLLAVAMVGSWCNFLTIAYIGFVGAHTLPVMYEKYADKVDSFMYAALDRARNGYMKLDKGVLSRLPTRRGSFKSKKHH